MRGTYILLLGHFVEMGRQSSKYINVMADNTATPPTGYSPYMVREGVENTSGVDEIGWGYWAMGEVEIHFSRVTFAESVYLTRRGFKRSCPSAMLSRGIGKYWKMSDGGSLKKRRNESKAKRWWSRAKKG
jgi:hypothetical protein